MAYTTQTSQFYVVRYLLQSYRWYKKCGVHTIDMEKKAKILIRGSRLETTCLSLSLYLLSPGKTIPPPEIARNLKIVSTMPLNRENSCKMWQKFTKGVRLLKFGAPEAFTCAAL